MKSIKYANKKLECADENTKLQRGDDIFFILMMLLGFVFLVFYSCNKNDLIIFTNISPETSTEKTQ